MTHIALIPARMGSVGFKFKNRILFKYTSDFLKKINWFKRVIVSTNDPEIKIMTSKCGYDVHNRSESLSGHKISIKDVYKSLIKDLKINDEAILWLFYLPVLYRNIDDFNNCKKTIEKEYNKSLTTFIPVITHPYDCWKYNESKKELIKYISNDVFRRQDKPAAWRHYHYITCFKTIEVDNLNHELVNSNTIPFFLDNKTACKLVNADTPEVYENWKKQFNNKEK